LPFITATLPLHSFPFSPYTAPPDLHSFPTRRSSDLYCQLSCSFPDFALYSISNSGFLRLPRMFNLPVVNFKLPLDRQQKLDRQRDRKSTRLNSSHVKISYAVFCLKKKKYSK